MQRKPSGRRPGAPAILLAPLAVALVLTLFAWPSARLEPRDLPVGVAGLSGAATAVVQQLERRGGAFDVHRYADEAAARAAIEDRDVYGAFVPTAAAPKVLVASAASPAVAQALTHAAEQGGGGTAAVEDVVGAPRGAALASSVLPLVLGGMITGIAAATLAGGALARTALLVGAAALAGVAGAAIVQGWLEVVDGDWLANAGALGLTVLAIGATVAGAKALFGEGGAIAGALTMILIGNPFSGVGSAPELLPEPVGGLGQLLPPGAGGNLLRSTGFFDGAAAGGHVAVLLAWTLGGLALLGLAALRERRSAPALAGAPA